MVGEGGKAAAGGYWEKSLKRTPLCAAYTGTGADEVMNEMP